uniref:Uncharacterized protein n=1 Tax=Oryza sativa subsp. japonica TaxID=39947 RepID=Q6Z8A2_ORYSJ|nr:hypothetical protein [Oryza sativa Japonica Group]BAD07897.1 hypothetical protein [Oryza sativa Japonica Group]
MPARVVDWWTDDSRLCEARTRGPGLTAPVFAWLQPYGTTRHRVRRTRTYTPLLVAYYSRGLTSGRGAVSTTAWPSVVVVLARVADNLHESGGVGTVPAVILDEGRCPVHRAAHGDSAIFKSA